MFLIFVVNCFSFHLVHCFRYYNLDAYHRHQMEKEMKRGPRKVRETERTVFDDEEQRRYVTVLDRIPTTMNELLVVYNCIFLLRGMWDWLKEHLQFFQFLSFCLWFMMQSLYDYLKYFRQELLREREILKEEQVEALKRSMQGGLVFFYLLFFCLKIVWEV